MIGKVRRAIELMNSNLNRRITLDELARSANLSKTHFSCLFRTQTGDSPGRYLMRLRMKKAAELLTTSTLSVKEVMASVGFNDKSDFVRSFKKAYGAAPSDYRDTGLNPGPRKKS